MTFTHSHAGARGYLNDKPQSLGPGSTHTWWGPARNMAEFKMSDYDK